MGDGLSINLSVYVGPYLKCTPAGIPEGVSDNLMNLIGEGDEKGFDAFGPNVKMKNITRQFVFQRHQDNPVTDIDSLVREMALFEAQFAHEIREIRGDYESVEVCWGIVPGWH